MKYFAIVILLFLVSPIWGQPQIISDGVQVNIVSNTLIGSPIATIDDMSWLEGNWKGEAFGGQTEEIWSAPAGKAMMGMFRLVDEGKTVFYELMIIREVEQTLIMHLKHFHDSLKGWEEKDDTVDFPLIKMTKDKVFFDGYTIERTSKDIITMNVIIESDKPEGLDFIYHRQ